MSDGMTDATRRVQIDLRRELHRHPDLSNDESATADRVRRFLESYPPDERIDEIGGAGLAAVYRGAAEGPCLVFRAELDALPIDEASGLEYASEKPGVSHKCGHDGHMAIVAGLAPFLHEARPARGQVVLLFQPAEETGEGAARVLESQRFRDLAPDQVYALHNLPGFPLGTVVLRRGVFASGSKGMIVRFRGITSHAAEPERGRSPALAIADLIGALSHASTCEGTFATVVYTGLGERAFGITPGFGEVLATLRSDDADALDALTKRCTSAVREISDRYGIPAEIDWTEVFPVTSNSDACAERIRKAAESVGASGSVGPAEAAGPAESVESAESARPAGSAGVRLIVPDAPFRWSEDFGHFTDAYDGALFGLGSGVDQPALHRPEFDFPDTLLERGTQLMLRIARDELG